MTVRLSIINFAGTTRTLVAVGTESEPSIDCTTLAATPRKGSTVAAPGVTKVGIGLTTGSAGLIVVVEVFIGVSVFSIIGLITCGVTTSDFATGTGGTGFANCDFGIGGVPLFTELFKLGVPL